MLVFISKPHFRQASLDQIAVSLFFPLVNCTESPLLKFYIPYGPLKSYSPFGNKWAISHLKIGSFMLKLHLPISLLKMAAPGYCFSSFGEVGSINNCFICFNLCLRFLGPNRSKQ